MDDKEVELKDRELALAERDMKLKEREAEAKIKMERRGLVFSSPLLIAIVSTIFGTAIGAGLQGYSDVRLERLKFEFSLVQAAFENAERDEAAKQLRFIANSGVIRNLDTDKLRVLADTPDDIPRVTFGSSGNGTTLVALPPGTTGTVVGDPSITKNVRSGPSTEADVLYKIAVGESLSLISLIRDQNNWKWYNVSSNDGDRQGWISHHLIETDTIIEEILLPTNAQFGEAR
ncbi:MAG: SH3 domain-containing protein [Cyanobacteria bacterium P01_H01_bin.105]